MVHLPSCPICHKKLAANAVESPLFPFCSARCKQVDLWRWCEGKYAIVDALTAEKLAENLSASGPAEEA